MFAWGWEVVWGMHVLVRQGGELEAASDMQLLSGEGMQIVQLLVSQSDCTAFQQAWSRSCPQMLQSLPSWILITLCTRLARKAGLQLTSPCTRPKDQQASQAKSPSDDAGQGGSLHVHRPAPLSALV